MYLYTNHSNIYTSFVYILECIPEKDCHINVDGLFLYWHGFCLLISER